MRYLHEKLWFVYINSLGHLFLSDVQELQLSVYSQLLKLRIMHAELHTGSIL